MKKFLRKRIKIDEIFCIKVALILLLICTSLLLCLNQSAINFGANGFSKLAKKPLQVYFLDVGQASATLIVLPNDQTMLIDTGSEDSAAKLVQDLDWILKENRLDCIDMLVLTHSDADHVGGAAEVLKNFQVYSAFRPKLLAREEMDLLMDYDYQIVYTNAYNSAIKNLYAEPNCQIEFVDNLHMQMGELSIDFYACEGTSSTETNYHSPFITLNYAGRTFMFTGDATAAREKEFMQMLQEKQIEIKVDFLQVAHHGSKYSSTLQFLETISPSLAFISAGDSTHPAQQVIRRLKDVGTHEILITKEDGTIGIGLDENSTFVIKSCSFYIDLPCIVVVLSLACFVTIFFIDGRPKQKAAFSSKK